MRRPDLKSSVLWVLVENVVTLLAAVLSTIFTAHIIGPEAFGVASIAFFVGSLAETLVNTPFAEALIQRSRLDVAVIDTAHTAMVFAGGVTFLLLCGLAPVIAWTYARPQLTALIMVQGCTCILLGLRGASVGW